MRVLSLIKMSETAGQAPQELFDAMDEVIKDLDATVTMLDTNGLLPSEMAGTKLISTGGRTTVLDGPFTESREIIGGYAIFEVDDFQQAVENTRKIIEVHEKFWPGWEGEAEVRQIMSPEQQPGA
jgi:hypothetical protein